MCDSMCMCMCESMCIHSRYCVFVHMYVYVWQSVHACNILYVISQQILFVSMTNFLQSAVMSIFSYVIEIWQRKAFYELVWKRTIYQVNRIKLCDVSVHHPHKSSSLLSAVPLSISSWCKPLRLLLLRFMSLPQGRVGPSKTSHSPLVKVSARETLTKVF